MPKFILQLLQIVCILFIFTAQHTQAQVVTDSLSREKQQQDTLELPPAPQDTVLRIMNLNPYFTLHVDSTLQYKLDVNKYEGRYFWFLTNPPVGLKINKDNGQLTFKAEKSFFLSGRLKYDVNYKVNVTVQNQNKPTERIDTFFTLVFYNTEIIPSKVKPQVNSLLTIEEGDNVSFRIDCDPGSFPIEQIMFVSSVPLKDYQEITKCGDTFSWTPSFDFIRDYDKEKEKKVVLSFIGANKFQVRDTAVVTITVRDALNFPQALAEYDLLKKNINTYILQLKYTFLQMDKKIRKTRGTRSTFELSSAATALGGTVFSSLPKDGQRTAGKILPSVGVAMVPVKESVAPNKTAEQSSATILRNSIKRLEYLLQNNSLIGSKDSEILAKTQKMRDELKQIQNQLVEVPIDFAGSMSEAELNNYFNNPKVNKKYRMKKK